MSPIAIVAEPESFLFPVFTDVNDVDRVLSQAMVARNEHP